MLFLKDEERIKKSCQTIVSPNSILPEASNVTDGVWCVATQRLLIPTVVCPQREKKIIHVNPPVDMMKLSMSCMPQVTT